MSRPIRATHNLRDNSTVYKQLSHKQEEPQLQSIHVQLGFPHFPSFSVVPHSQKFSNNFMFIIFMFIIVQMYSWFDRRVL